MNEEGISYSRFSIFSSWSMNKCENCESTELEHLVDEIVHCLDCGQYYQFNEEEDTFDEMTVAYG